MVIRLVNKYIPAASIAALLVAFAPSSALDLRLPDMGDPSLEFFGAEEERDIGQAVMQSLRGQELLVEDVALNEYINSVGQRIAAYTDFGGVPYTFFLVRDGGINAFAAPGGHVGINAGLVLATRSEGEMAGVLAHEIAHVSQRHVARSIADSRRMALPMAAAMIAAAAVASAGDSQAGSAALAGTMAWQQQRRVDFTRANEQDADRVGTRLLQQSGYDPQGMGDFFARLEQLTGSRGEIPDFLLSHPRPSSRLGDSTNRLGDLAQNERPVDSLAYKLAKARLKVIDNGNPQKLISDFEASPGQSTDQLYGYALALAQSGRYPQALEVISQLRSTDPDNLAYRIEEASIALAQGQMNQGWQHFADADALYSGDFTLAMAWGGALATQGDPRAAMRVLQPHLSERPGNARLHQQFAQAAQRAGDAATAYATLAEYHYLNGNPEQAVDQAERAMRRPEISPFQQAQVQARLQEYRKAALEARKR